jgi:hypothetical protein
LRIKSDAINNYVKTTGVNQDRPQQTKSVVGLIGELSDVFCHPEYRWN